MLRPDTDSYEVTGHLDYILDPSRSLALADVMGDAAGRFEPVGEREANFGFRPDWVWLRLPVRNEGPAAAWRVAFANNFLSGFSVYLAHGDGRVETLVDLGPDSPFAARPIASPQLAAPLPLGAGEAATLYVRYWSGGSTGLAFTIDSLETFVARESLRASKVFFFQGIMGLLVLAGIAMFAATRQRAPLYYAAYLASCTVFLLHGDGFGFQQLWPRWPGFNNFATLFLGGLMIVTSAAYVRTFLSTPKGQPIVDKLLIAVMAIAVALNVGGLVWDGQPLKQATVLVVGCCTLLYLGAGLNARRKGVAEARFFVLAWLGVALGAMLMVGRYILGLEISRDATLDGMRVVVVYDALMMGLALLDNYAITRRHRRRALEESLRATQRNLELHQRLERLEQSYELAAAMARNSRRQLADVTHDLRGPVHALRVSLRELAGAVDSGRATALDESFAYVEGLVNTYLADAVAAEADQTPADATAIPVQLVLGNVAEMFAEEARASGQAFTCLRSSATVRADPLPLMRVLANLVSNALRYAPGGRVLLGCRRRGDMLSIEVHDSGPGMDDPELRQVMRRSARGSAAPAADGAGLGLSIAADLARQAGFGLEADSTPGKGTCFRVRVPLVRTSIGAG